MTTETRWLTSHFSSLLLCSFSLPFYPFPLSISASSFPFFFFLLLFQETGSSRKVTSVLAHPSFRWSFCLWKKLFLPIVFFLRHKTYLTCAHLHEHVRLRFNAKTDRFQRNPLDILRTWKSELKRLVFRQISPIPTNLAFVSLDENYVIVRVDFVANQFSKIIYS